jgi:acetylglutamate synthase
MSLALELQNDPLARGYAAMNTGQTLASLLATDRNVLVEHFITDRTLYSSLGPVMAESILSKMAAAAATDATINRALNWISQRDGLNIGDPVSQAMVDQLVGNSVFTAAEGSAIKGLGLALRSRADELCLAVDWGIVNAARAALGWSIL